MLQYFVEQEKQKSKKAVKQQIPESIASNSPEQQQMDEYLFD